jgi:hypothetical protein
MVFDPERNSMPLFITVLGCEVGWDTDSGIANMLSGTTMVPNVMNGEVLTVFPMVVPLMLRVAPVTKTGVVDELSGGSLCAAKGHAPAPSMSAAIQRWREKFNTAVF